jgi:hypothetical protein
MTKATTESQSAAGQDVFERLDHALDVWRGRIDELVVRADLGARDVGDEIRKRIDIAENAFLAVRSRLDDARSDVSQASSVHQGIDQLLHDLDAAFKAADAVVRRGSEK